MTICTSILKKGSSRPGEECGRHNCGIHNKKGRPCLPSFALIVATIVLSQNPLQHLLQVQLPQIIYNNQIIAATEITQQFKNKKFVNLTAQCQSGKTGVARQTIANFSQLKNGKVIPIVIVPMNDNDPKNQARFEFFGLVNENHILCISQMKDPKSLKRIIDTNREANPGFSFLIIIDESHLGSTINRETATTCLLKTLQTAGISPNGLNCPDDCSVLSISATPNAEIAGLIQANVSSQKARVILQPGEGYYGIRDMFELKRVHESFDLKTIEGRGQLSQLIANNYQNTKKYILIRAKDCERSDDLKAVLHAHNPQAKVHQYDSRDENCEFSLDSLHHEPDQLTIVIIVNRCRASMQLDTQHIAMVHDNGSAETDTTTQGLAGRMCGYGKMHHGVQIYCNVDALNNQRNWIESGYESDCIPKVSKIVGGVSSSPKASDSWEKSIPKCNSVSQLKKVALQTELDNWHNDKLNVTFYQKPAVQNFINDVIPQAIGAKPLKGNGIMVLKSDNSSFTKFWAAKDANIANNIPHHGCALSDINRNNFLNCYGYFIYVNMIANHPQYGQYRIYYTKSHADGLPHASSRPSPKNIQHEIHNL
jgi:hypothetical protein